MTHHPTITALLLANPYARSGAMPDRCGRAPRRPRQRSTEASAGADLLPTAKLEQAAQGKAKFWWPRRWRRGATSRDALQSSRVREVATEAAIPKRRNTNEGAD
jgi:hypothetical protein